MTQAAKLLLLIVLREIRSNKNTLSNDKGFVFSGLRPLWVSLRDTVVRGFSSQREKGLVRESSAIGLGYK